MSSSSLSATADSKEPRGRQLLRVAGDHHAFRPQEHGHRLFEPALRRLVEHDDVEQAQSRGKICATVSGLAIHTGRKVVQRVTAFKGLTDRDHLPQPHRTLATRGQPAAKIGAEAVQPSAGACEQLFAFCRLPQRCRIDCRTSCFFSASNCSYLAKLLCSFWSSTVVSSRLALSRRSISFESAALRRIARAVSPVTFCSTSL